MKKYTHKAMDNERALYMSRDIELVDCSFTGQEDGESALKECQNVVVSNTLFDLRYPLWRTNNIKATNIEMTENARSSVWYSNNVEFSGSKLHGVKIFRMCSNVVVKNCDVDSIEFGWNTKNIVVENTTMKSEYPFLRGENITVKNCVLDTKYPFQQTKHVRVDSCTIKAKDAFWDSEDVVVKNSTIIGDFLAWHSKNITLINCKIISSQPLCYDENVVVRDCDMSESDLAFEYSSVEASIKGHIISVKNPEKGTIVADSIGEVIFGNGINKTNATVVDKSKE